jgi:hypothetical protein
VRYRIGTEQYTKTWDHLLDFKCSLALFLRPGFRVLVLFAYLDPYPDSNTVLSAIAYPYLAFKINAVPGLCVNNFFPRLIQHTGSDQ